MSSSEKKPGIAVLFPGIGYHTDKPLLYYAGRMAEKEFGYDCVRLRYQALPGNVKGNSARMRAAYAQGLAQTEQQLAEVDFSKYEHVVFISKSLGTAVAASYAGMHGISAEQIYYTPLVETFEAVRKGIGLAFHGTADPWADTEKLLALSEEYEIPLELIADANHSLETGNTLRDLGILTEVMQRTRAFFMELQS